MIKMAVFYTSLTCQEISAQIADMLNAHNKWQSRFTPYAISMSSAYYFVEIVLDRVVGCASLLPISQQSSKLQHICVLPEYRKHGIGKKIVKKVLDNCQTGHIFMTIREDNVPSIRLAQNLGFRYTNKHWFRDHWTLTFEKGFIQNERTCQEVFA